jgi:hypothetical protein
MELRKVDHSAIRVTQAFTIGLLLLAFVLDAPWLAAAVAVLNLITALNPDFGLFRRLYLDVLRPSGLVKPDVIEDNPEPHRFSQGLGALFVGIGLLFMLAGLPGAGWAFVWLVIGLASLSLFLNFCAGCFMYYQFNRLGVPGFRHSPIKRG